MFGLYTKFVFFLFIFFKIEASAQSLQTTQADSNLNNVFFNICNVKNDDLERINFVIKNSNERYIQSSIEDIENETLKRAVYLLIFYRYNNGHTLPDGAIETVGYEIMKNVKNLSIPYFNFLFKKKVPFNKIKEQIKEKQLSFIQKKNILLNYQFAILSGVIDNTSSKNFKYVNNLLNQVFGNILISYEDILKFQKIYRKIISDEMIMQQIRMRLLRHKTNDLQKLINIMHNDIMKNHAQKLVYFYNHYSLKKLQKKSSKYQKAKSNYSCDVMAGYDEYSDLICIKKNEQDSVFVKKLLSNNNNPSFVPYEWLEYRIKFARNAILDNNIKELKNAYNIVSKAGLLTEERYYIQQFLSGFLAFLLEDFHTALVHFSRCSKCAKRSNSQGKALYWLAMTYKKLNDEDNYTKTLTKAIKNKLSLYGQLAMDDLDINAYEHVKNNIESAVDIKGLCNNVLFVAGYISQSIYKNDLSSLLLEYINANHLNKDELYNSLLVINNDFDYKIGLTYARFLKKYDVALENLTFPLIEFTDDSLVNAVIQQESGFKTDAISNKGARGIMQIMPSTGKMITQDMKIEYNSKRLLYDREYNVRIGQFYLKQLLDRFDGHKLLALASYNAGSSNTRKWIQKNGDPRNMQTNEEIAIWIEKIPFTQTRDYVVRILGAEMVYDAIKALKEERRNQ